MAEHGRNWLTENNGGQAKTFVSLPYPFLLLSGENRLDEMFEENIDQIYSRKQLCS